MLYKRHNVFAAYIVYHISIISSMKLMSISSDFDTSSYSPLLLPD